MFKETYGFDMDLFSRGVGVSLADNHKLNTGLMKFCGDEYEYWDRNLTGHYLVDKSASHELTLRCTNGDLLNVPIRHFIGETPRMSIDTFK